MGPLVTAIFLLLISGTTMSKTPEELLFSPCDSLVYNDMTVSNPRIGRYSFTNEAFFNNKLVYKYDSRSEKAKPQPRWKNAENWDQISQVQKERGKFALENVELIRNAFGYKGNYNFNGIFGCEVCDNDIVRVGWIQYGNGEKLVTFNASIPAWEALNPEGEVIKKKWEEDPMAPGRAKSYLEKECTEKLQEYKNYKNTN